jgi:hypothetical protein
MFKAQNVTSNAANHSYTRIRVPSHCTQPVCANVFGVDITPLRGREVHLATLLTRSGVYMRTLRLSLTRRPSFGHVLFEPVITLHNLHHDEVTPFCRKENSPETVSCTTVPIRLGLDVRGRSRGHRRRAWCRMVCGVQCACGREM